MTLRYSTLRFLTPDGLVAAADYSHVAVTSGTLLHIAGQVALNSGGQTVGVGDFGAQAEQALENLECALAAAGTQFASIAALTIYVTAAVQRSDLAALRESLLARIANQAPPAVTFLFVQALLDPQWLIEIQAVAVAEKPLSALETAMLELGA